MLYLAGLEGQEAIDKTEEVLKSANAGVFDRRLKFHKAFSAYPLTQADASKVEMQKGNAYRKYISTKLTGKGVITQDEA